MKRIYLASATVVTAFGFLAAGTVNFNDNTFAKSINSIAAAAVQNIGADKTLPIKPVEAKTGKFVQVSGQISMSGSGWVPANGGSVSVRLSGWGTFRDASGAIASNNTTVSAHVSVQVKPNQSVSRSESVYVSASFYRAGKYVGSARMNGNVQVSGRATGTHLSLNGKARLTGSVYAEDVN